MTDEVPNQATETAKPSGRWRRRIGVCLIAVAAVLLVLKTAEHFLTHNAGRTLAAIDAARAVPDSENAAVIYRQLLQDYGKTDLPWHREENISWDVTLHKPWQSRDYPELAAWLAQQNDLLAKLRQACTFEKCWFPLGSLTNLTQIAAQIDSRMTVLSAVRGWAQLLVCAANNDIAEGRVDAATDKFLCVLKMGRHFCRQGLMIDYLVGIAVEAIGLAGIREFVVEHAPTENQLKQFEDAVLQQKDQWRSDFESAAEVEILLEKSQGLPLRFGLWLQRLRSPVADAVKHIEKTALRSQSVRQGTVILIALRRFRDKTGRWPESLEQIKDLVGQEILTDPVNDSSFVYKLTETGFTLYSTGPNKIDDGGVRGDDKDDQLIWPPPYRMTQKEKANVE